MCVSAWCPARRSRCWGLLENLEVDAGLTYLENEPLGKVRSIPLYNESYRLLTAPDGMFGDRDQVTWKEVGQVPLCLLTPDMQNRRIIDRALKSAGVEAIPTLTSNSIIVLYSHVKTGRWASVMPAKLAETLGLSDAVRSIPIVDPAIHYSVGLVVPQRDPLTPLIAALAQIGPRSRADAGVVTADLSDRRKSDSARRSPTIGSRSRRRLQCPWPCARRARCAPARRRSAPGDPGRKVLRI